MDALNDFVTDMKNGRFGSAYNPEMHRRLMALQEVGGPQLQQHASYQTAPAMVAAGGGYGQNMGQSAYSLPPLNLRTKDDLTQLDNYINQITGHLYENPQQLSAAGVGQPGAQYVGGGGMGFRSSDSPPSLPLPSTHANSNVALAMASQSMAQVSTPSLTPASSAHSYTSGQSPVSTTSNSGPHANNTNNQNSMYPQLPGTTQDSSNGAYATSAAPTATLGTSFDDPRRRYGGGMLQKAYRSSHDENSDGSTTPPAVKHSSRDTTPKNENMPIDPALSGNMASLSTTGGVEPKQEENQEDKTWLEGVRVLEAIQRIIRGKLENHEFEDGGHNDESQGGDVDMGMQEHQHQHQTQQHEVQGQGVDDVDTDEGLKKLQMANMEHDNNLKRESESLYPSLG